MLRAIRAAAPAGGAPACLRPANEQYHVLGSVCNRWLSQQEVTRVRGTQDWFGDTASIRKRIIDTFKATSKLYAYSEISTPILEFTNLFQRSLGDGSDVVSKEMYTFMDRSGNSLTMRPENTAGVVRAVLNNGLTANLPQRLYYSGPMFRYERPQKGRLREFVQFGVECLGPATPVADLEVIAMAAQALQACKLSTPVVLHLNTLGDAASQAAYQTVLHEFLQSRKADLSADSISRLERGAVLRILDSKDPADHKVLEGAPNVLDSLTPDARDRFAQLTAGLHNLGVDFVIDNKLVRGLDYYCHTVFEFVAANTTEGMAGTVLAGGRYDRLMSDLGGPVMPSIGWAAGLERLVLLSTLPPEAPPTVAVVPIVMGAPDPKLVEVAALRTAQRLRQAGVSVSHVVNIRAVKKMMKEADGTGAGFAVLIGEEEVRDDMVSIKVLATTEQVRIPVADLPAFIAARTCQK